MAALRKTALQNRNICTCRHFFMSLMVKVRGRTSNRNQTDGRKCPKNLGWQWRDQHCVTGARRQGFEVAEWSWIWPGVIHFFLRQVVYKFIPVGHEHYKLLAWPCMIASWHHYVTNARTCHFFAVCLAVLLFDFRSTTFTIDRLLRKKIYQIRAYDCGVQYSFNNYCSTKSVELAEWDWGGGGGGSLLGLIFLSDAQRKYG